MTSIIMAADKIGLHTLASWFKRLEAKLAHRAYINRTIRELEQLTDYELRDIGISRANIRSVAYEKYLDNRKAHND